MVVVMASVKEEMSVASLAVSTDMQLVDKLEEYSAQH